MEDNYREVKKAEPCLKLIHMDQVEVEEIEWLFYLEQVNAKQKGKKRRTDREGR